MADDYDSWISGLGVEVDKYQAGDSVLSGLKQVASSAVEAASDMKDAALDAKDAAVSYAKGKLENTAADALDYAGADETAKALRKDATKAQADADADWNNAGKDLNNAKKAVLGDDPPEDGQAQTVTPRSNGPAKMLPDCKVVRGKVPGPVNHVLCGTHGHVLDIAAGTIIAASIEEYKKLYGSGGGGAGKAKGNAGHTNYQQKQGGNSSGGSRGGGGGKFRPLPGKIKGTVNFAAQSDERPVPMEAEEENAPSQGRDGVVDRAAVSITETEEEG